MGERHERHEAPPTTVGVRFVVGAVLLMAGVVITDAPMMARAVTPVPVTSIATAREKREAPRARERAPALARDAARPRKASAGEERGGPAIAHSSLFCNTMVVVNVRRM